MSDCLCSYSFKHLNKWVFKENCCIIHNYKPTAANQTSFMLSCVTVHRTMTHIILLQYFDIHITYFQPGWKFNLWMDWLMLWLMNHIKTVDGHCSNRSISNIKVIISAARKLLIQSVKKYFNFYKFQKMTKSRIHQQQFVLFSRYSIMQIGFIWNLFRSKLCQAEHPGHCQGWIYSVTKTTIRWQITFYFIFVLTDRPALSSLNMSFYISSKIQPL